MGLDTLLGDIAKLRTVRGLGLPVETFAGVSDRLVAAWRFAGGALKTEVARRWGTIDLLDMLENADQLTDLTTEFVPVATREALPKDAPRRRLLMCLFALGTNTGIRALVAIGQHAEDEGVLRRCGRRTSRGRTRARDRDCGQRDLRRAGPAVRGKATTTASGGQPG